MNLRWRYLYAIICMIFILACNIYILKTIFGNADTSLAIFNSFHSSKETREVKTLNQTAKKALLSSSFKAFSHLNTGLKCDLWFDICLTNGIHHSLWHPLYPILPQDEHILQNLDTLAISKEHQQSLKRIYGFIEIDRPSRYTLSFLFDGALEVIFLFTGVSIPSKWDQHFKEIFHFEQNNKKDFFSSSEHEVFLKRGYYAVEIVSSSNVKISWKNKHDSLSILNSTVIFHQKTTENSYFSYLTSKHYFKDHYPLKDLSEEKKLSFYNYSQLEKYTPNQVKASLFCPEMNIPAPKVKLFKGIYMIDNILVYPKEYLEFTDAMPTQRLLLPETKAQEVAAKTVQLLSQVYQRNLFLKSIIHIHTNINGKFKPHSNVFKTYYYVELHVEDNKTKLIHQVSHFVQDLPSGFCLKKDYKKNSQSQIFLLTPVKNQYVWLKYLLHVLTDVFSKTKETNVTLVLLDNESSDGNYEQLLESTKDVPSKYILTKNKKFSKVKILNEGLKAVPKDGIAMILDLHLQIPLDFFDRTRKLTIAGKTAFSPTLMRFQDPCFHERYTELALKKVIWQDDGPGIMAMYKSDWSRVGGFNEKMFADKWGGEDWELVDRIIATGIQIIHYRLPRFYHLYHSRKKMWNHY